MEPQTIVIEPQPGPQELFLSSDADICIYGGSAGSGKSYALLLECIRHINSIKGFGAVVFRRTYPEVKNKGGLWDTSLLMFPYAGGTPKESDLSWVFAPHGNSIKFAHMEHEKNKLDWQGSQIPLICFDELTHFSEQMFFYMLSRNRSLCGVKPYVRATTNPDADSWLASFIDWWIGEDGYPIPERSGVVRWFIRYNDELIWANSKQELIDEHPNTFPKSVTFIPAKLSDNVILEQQDPGYRANLMALGRVERERLLDGNWKVRPSAGMYFQRDWFEMVDAAPAGPSIRHWDLAASEPTTSYPDPDWTAGVKLVESKGITYVVDVRHIRRKSAGVEDLILHTASVDGTKTAITMEQEPGSSGKMAIAHYAKLLKGYNFRGVPSLKNKEVRVGPVSAAAEHGLVKVVRADWNETFFNELEAFPDGKHDDICDGLSGSFNSMKRPRRKPPTTTISFGGSIPGSRV